MARTSQKTLRAPKTPAETVDILHAGGHWGQALKGGYKTKIVRWCEAARSADRKGSISVVLADDKFIHDLNYQYRGFNKPTNVLSFTAGDDALGDIVLGYETIRREAQEQGKSFEAHMAHMLVHGVLHLQGFDHETKKEAEQMETMEIAILGKLGFTNPYEVR